MNCRNCGAPMKLVEDRDYFVCEYCASVDFPGESADHVRVLDERSDVACPICQESLVVASVEEIRVLHCMRCKGVLMYQSAFSTFLQILQGQKSGPASPPVPLNAEDLERQILCPYCRQPMDTHPYYGPGNIVIDNCASCAVLWLDFGELGRITNSYWYDRMLRT